MLQKNVIEKVTGFRTLDDNEIEAVSGGAIVVIGTRTPDGCVSVTSDDLALIGVFGAGPDINLPGTHDTFPGDGGAGGGEGPVDLTLTEDKKIEITIDADGEKLTAKIDPSDASLDQIKFELKDGNNSVTLNVNLASPSSDGSFPVTMDSGAQTDLKAFKAPDPTGPGFIITFKKVF